MPTGRTGNESGGHRDLRSSAPGIRRAAQANVAKGRSRVASTANVPTAMAAPRPIAQPATTSVGQCTPSTSVLTPTAIERPSAIPNTATRSAGRRTNTATSTIASPMPNDIVSAE